MAITYIEDYHDTLDLIAEPTELSFPLLLAKLEAQGRGVVLSNGVRASHYYGEEPVEMVGRDGTVSYARKSRLIMDCGLFLRKLLGAKPENAGIDGAGDIAMAFVTASKAACQSADTAELPNDGSSDLRYRTCLAAANELSTLAVMFGAQSPQGAKAIDTLLGLAERNFNAVAGNMTPDEDKLVIGYTYWRALADIVSIDADARETVWINLGERLKNTDRSADRMLAALRLPTADYLSQSFTRLFAEMVLVAPSQERANDRHKAYRSIAAKTEDAVSDLAAFFDYPVRLTAEGMKIEQLEQRVGSSGFILRRLAGRGRVFMPVGRLFAKCLDEASRSPLLTAYGDRFAWNARAVADEYYYAAFRSSVRPEPKP